MMPLRLWSLVAVSSIGLACRSKQIVATEEHGKSAAAPVDDASYFPLIAGTVYEYDSNFGSGSHERRIVRAKDLAFGRVFYFEDADSKDLNQLITSNAFGLGVYRVTSQALETGDAWAHDDVAKITASAMLPAVRFPIHEGAVLEVPSHVNLQITVIGPETVTVPAGTYACIKFEQNELWSEEKHHGSFWLARGIGTVKRVWVNGSTEVLTAVHFPPSGS